MTNETLDNAQASNIEAHERRVTDCKSAKNLERGECFMRPRMIRTRTAATSIDRAAPHIERREPTFEDRVAPVGQREQVLDHDIGLNRIPLDQVREAPQVKLGNINTDSCPTRSNVAGITAPAVGAPTTRATPRS